MMGRDGDDLADGEGRDAMEGLSVDRLASEEALEPKCFEAKRELLESLGIDLSLFWKLPSSEGGEEGRRKQTGSTLSKTRSKPRLVDPCPGWPNEVVCSWSSRRTGLILGDLTSETAGPLPAGRETNPSDPELELLME